ncbi:hypothetical protein P4O66_009532, partial [Electrophorus voltai]
STTIESPETEGNLTIPQEYQDLAEVFSKEKATQLPPSTGSGIAPYLPGARPTLSPRRKPGPWKGTSVRPWHRGTYAPPHPQHQQACSLLRKRTGLRPCVDYQGLKEKLVKYPYPLPLVPVALEQVREAQYFMRLDLHSAYNLIRIREGDEWKTDFSTSSGHNEYLVLLYGLFQAYIDEVLRAFLARSVIAYVDDILIYSASFDQHVCDVCKMLRTLLENQFYCKIEKFEFHCRQETPSDETGAGGVEALAGGSKTPLRCHYRPQEPQEYLQSAKRLNSRQARCSLFFFRFVFCVTYRPGEKYVRADVLSPLHHAEAWSSSQEPILPPACFMGAITWDIDCSKKTANAHPQCPPNWLYVPLKHRSDLITWAHTSVGTGHSGSTRTTQLLSARYWWPTMHREVVRYVSSCTNCAHSKTPCTPSAGKLIPLPMPWQLWSHVSRDFITDLPASEENTTILVVVDRFSKMTGESVHLKAVEGTTGKAKYYREPNIKLPSLGQWPSGESKPGGYQPPVYPWNPPVSDQPSVEQWCQGSEQVWEETHRRLHSAIAAYKRKADWKRAATPPFKPGQKVWVTTREGKMGPLGKLRAK